MSRRVFGIVGVASVAIIVIAIIALTGVGGRGPSPAALGPPHYVDETAAAGISHTYGGPYPYAVGGGVAVWDCDADGRPDLYLAGGAGPGILYRNVSPAGGRLKFVPVHDPMIDQADVTGAYPIDIDGDGMIDLAVIRNGQNVVLRGLGQCRFERANERWGLDGGRSFTTAFSATWEGTAMLPTLAFGNYVTDAENPDPNHLCSDNELIRPNAEGTRYDAPIPLTPAWCALSMLFSDWDRSGRRDLRISNDRHYYSSLSDGQEQLWRISPGEGPRLYTADDGWVSMQIWGMGIASYDLTGDGFPEVFLTSQGDNKLQTLSTDATRPAYRDIALKRGVTATRPFTGGDVLPSTAWHPQFEDVNNDGLIDLFISKGNVNVQPDFATRDPSDLFLGQPDGTFAGAADTAGILNYARGRGAALVDLNLDGLLDLVELNDGAPVELWRNAGAGDAARAAPMGDWVALRITQPNANRDAIGAWVEVRVGELTLRRELTVGGGHAGGQLGWIHFGLGKATELEVRVLWPDGEAGPWMRVPANSFAVIDRNASEARPWLPPAD